MHKRNGLFRKISALLISALFLCCHNLSDGHQSSINPQTGILMSYTCARGVYTPKGESLYYVIWNNGEFVVHDNEFLRTGKLSFEEGLLLYQYAIQAKSASDKLPVYPDSDMYITTLFIDHEIQKFYLSSPQLHGPDETAKQASNRNDIPNINLLRRHNNKVRELLIRKSSNKLKFDNFYANRIHRLVMEDCGISAKAPD